MNTRERLTARLAWYDGAVTNAADIWHHDPDDCERYHRVHARSRRRDWVPPTLRLVASAEKDSPTASTPEPTDALAEDQPRLSLFDPSVELYLTDIIGADVHDGPET